MSDTWTERLSEYLDGDLAAGERAALEAHLDGCAGCRETLADLRRVVARARALEDREPAADLWPGIAGRIGARTVHALEARRARRLSFSIPQLAAAGIALTAMSGSLAWLLHPNAPAAVAVQPAPSAGTTPALNAGSTGTRVRSYDTAVADLEQVLKEGRGRLDTTTVRVLEQNLATIDRAIAQARLAVAADSANMYLNSHLAATMRRKLELLRQAATLVSSAS